MSRLVQTGSTARANTRNKCYRGLSSKQVESSAIRRHIWWILLQLGDNFFLGSQGRTKVWKKKKAAIPLIQLSPQMKQWPVQVSARLVITVVGTIIFRPSALVDNESPTPIRLSQLTLLRHLPPHVPLLCLCCQRCPTFSFRGSFLWVKG